MTSPQRHQNALAGNSKPGQEQKDFVPNSKEISSSNRKFTEQLLRGIFTKHKNSPEYAREQLTHEVGEAFRSFRSSFTADPLKAGKKYVNENIKERIENLQKRTSDTLQALANCKDDVSSVSYLPTKTRQSSEIDETVIPDTKSFNSDELAKEEIKNRARARHSSSSSSATTMHLENIQDMKNATLKLLDELGRISDSYNDKENDTSCGLSTVPRK